MRFVPRGSVATRNAVSIAGSDGEMEEAAASVWLVGCTGSSKVRIVTNRAGTCDELLRPGPRVDKAVGRVIPPVFPGAQIDDRDRAPVVIRRVVNHRDTARDHPAIPIGVVDDDLAGVNDLGDNRDMARRNISGPPEYQDRAHSRDVAALIEASCLFPPAARRPE